ncbi:hypothetical protein [Chryseobacterium sp. SIMBA_028]|uniref:hypothetical protein n=3 Tax=Bacteria TaxID=2 RepID=UPI00397DE791
MKVLAAITLLSAIIFSSCNKAKQVSGTYIIQSEMLPKVNGCCANTEIMRLNEDQTFSMYHQNDQGDYTTEDFATGTFQLAQGVVSLKPDSINTHFDLSEATFRKEHADHGMDYLTRQDNKAKYHKINFEKADSLYIRRVNSDTWESEEITVKKDGTVRYVLYSSDKSQHTMAHIKNKKLTKEQFREYVETMSQSSIFQSGIISKKHEISLLLNISEQNISLYDHNNIDKKLYDFFFEKVRSWVQ